MAPKPGQRQRESAGELELLRTVFLHTTKPLAYLDAEFRFVMVNPAWTKACGRTSAELIGSVLFAIFPDAEIESLFRQAKATGEPTRFKDKPFKFADQQERGVTYWDGTLVPARGSSGEVAGWVLSVLETTERKRAEEQNLVNDARLRLALDTALLVFFEWDLQKDEVRRWASSRSLLGGTPADSPEKSEAFFRIIHPEDRDIFESNLQAALSGLTPRYENEFRIIALDGSEVWLQENGWVERDAQGHPTRLIGLSQDVTARKQAEAAARESDADFRAMFEISSVGQALADCITRRFVRVNNGFCAITGYSNSELLQMRVDDLDHPEAREEDQELFRKMAVGEADHFQTEKRYVRKDGRSIWVHVSGNVIRAKGQRPRSVAVIQDITHRKALQEELERLVAERTAKLYELVSELEHFSYAITHDMRAPLRAIRSFAEVLCDSPEVQSAHAQTYLERIINSVERMDTLVTDALRYSSAVRRDLPLSRVNLDILLRGILASYPKFLAATACIQIDDTLPSVMGNEAGLTQCFSNLLDNALKFVPPGAQPKVRVWSEVVENSQAPRAASRQVEGSPSKWVRVWVEDQGIGISANMLPRVFQMFSRGAGNYPGTGIGLALVRKVTQRMGGKVGVFSEQGKGSRFWMDLIPVDPAQS